MKNISKITNKTGVLTFSGLVFYLVHVLQQAQARDAQIGSEQNTVDNAEVNVAESTPSEAVSPVIAELDESPLSNTETIASADLSLVQVADDDDDEFQGKDAVVVDDQPEGGISPIFLVGSTVLIGAGALIVNSNDNDDSSTTTVTTNDFDRYDFDSQGISPLDDSDSYNHVDFKVGVAQSIDAGEASVVSFELWPEAKGSSTLDSSGDITMYYWAPGENDQVTEKSVKFDGLSSDSDLVSMGELGFLALRSGEDSNHYGVTANHEAGMGEVTLDDQAVDTLATASDYERFGSLDKLQFISAVDDDAQTLDILSFDATTGVLSVVEYDWDSMKSSHTNFDHVDFHQVAGSSFFQLLSKDNADNTYDVRLQSIDYNGETESMSVLGVDAYSGLVGNFVSNNFHRDGSVHVSSYDEPSDTSSIYYLNEGVATVIATEITGVVEIKTCLDMNVDNKHDVLFTVNAANDASIAQFGMALSSGSDLDGNGVYDDYSVGTISLPVGMLTAFNAEPIMGNDGVHAGVHFFADGVVGPVSALMSMESLQEFGDVAAGLSGLSAPVNLQELLILHQTGAVELPIGIIQTLASEIEAFPDLGPFGFQLHEEGAIADILGIG